MNLQNQNCSNIKAPQYLLTSDQGSPQITCVGYWVTFFINEQSLPTIFYRLWGQHSSIQGSGSITDEGFGDRGHCGSVKACAVSLLHMGKDFTYKKINLYKIILGRNWAVEYPFCCLPLFSVSSAVPALWAFTYPLAHQTRRYRVIAKWQAPGGARDKTQSPQDAHCPDTQETVRINSSQPPRVKNIRFSFRN